ncbi:Chromate resistance protein ChrB [Priestia aryabhattai]|nr:MULTISPECIES: Chromate resistance protein ChrB [Priestia]
MLEIERLSLSSEQMVTSKFNQERTLEYKEFIEESNKFLQEIEENEAELRRLKKWLVKIKKRDYFLCETNKEASDLFEKCNKVLEEFTEKLYLCEGLVEEKNV